MENVIDLFKNDRFSARAGIKIVETLPGYAKCTMEVTEDHLNGIGVLMGGATFTLADFTFSLAANSYGTIAVSQNANITYMRRCNHGMVTAIATEISRTKRIGVYRVSITDEENQLIAEFTGTCYFKEGDTSTIFATEK
jgi:acyl-CoA thioesterase